MGLPECGQTEISKVVMRPYREVKGRRVIKPGDILFVRIEPSIFNQKYVLVEDLKGHEYAYTSTEFYVLTPKKDQTIPAYIYGMLFSSFIFAQVQGKTTGSSGRRRLDPELFKSLKIPNPSIEIQKEIAEEVVHRREKARCLRGESEHDWSRAKSEFEAELFGGLEVTSNEG